VAGGYRVYDDADLDRLHRVLAYRELGFALDQVAQIIDDPQAGASSHLRRQHALVLAHPAAGVGARSSREGDGGAADGDLTGP